MPLRDAVEGVGEAQDGAHLEVLVQFLTDARQLRDYVFDTYKLLRCA